VKFRNGVIYKTHDYPNIINLENDPKIIFMFGSPLDSAVSATKRINAWGEEHYLHLHSDKFIPNEQLIHEDALLLEDLFDSWYKIQKFPFLSVRYESLYEDNVLQRLNDFLGYRLQMIPFEERKSSWKNHPKKDILKKTYNKLLEKINNAENVKIWEPER